MSAITRRGALSLVPAAVASVAVPAVALAAHADAQLIQLSAEFDAAYAVWQVTWERENSLNSKVLAEFYRTHVSIDANREAFTALCNASGLNAAGDANGDACERINGIVEAIFRLEPSSLAGLAAWARAFRWERLTAGVWEDWNDPRDEEETFLLKLLKAIHRAAGEA